MTTDVLLTALFVAGLAVASVGVGLIYLPAGLIVAGVAAAAASVLYARGSGR